MSFWGDVAYGSTLGLWDPDKENADAEAAANAKDQGLIADRDRRMKEGLAQGAAKGEALYGMNDAAVGTNIQDIIQRRKDQMEKPSRAAEEVRSRGAQQQRQIASRGGSEAQKRQAATDTAGTAGVIEDQAYQQNLQSFQSLMGNIASNKSALELGYGSLGVASQYIAPPEGKKGILSGLFDGLL